VQRHHSSSGADTPLFIRCRNTTLHQVQKHHSSSDAETLLFIRCRDTTLHQVQKHHSSSGAETLLFIRCRDPTLNKLQGPPLLTRCRDHTLQQMQRPYSSSGATALGKITHHQVQGLHFSTDSETLLFISCKDQHSGVGTIATNQAQRSPYFNRCRDPTPHQVQIMYHHSSTGIGTTASHQVQKPLLNLRCSRSPLLARCRGHNSSSGAESHR
jgi:hypothetical protein